MSFFLRYFLILITVTVFTIDATAAAKQSSSKSTKKTTAVKSQGRGVPNLAKAPYASAIVVDVSTGNVLFEDKADSPAFPASVVKLMDLLIIQEKIEQGSLKLTDMVKATAEATRMGGSGVYLKEHEEFSVEEMLFALMIKSANDAALALAIHVAGSRDAFVQLMNEKAVALGMTSTKFVTPHGLPPSRGQSPDVTSARDISLLCLELVKHPDVFKYTSSPLRYFRDNKLEMRTHNNLLGKFQGCDGFKTGWWREAGYSLAATAMRDNRRVIAVVMGSTSKELRDSKANELLSSAFMNLPPLPPPPPVKHVVLEEIQPPFWSPAKIVVLSLIALVLLLAAARAVMKRFSNISKYN